MEAGTTSTTLTVRLPILNPREYDLWLIRIEQYFLMTDYSLLEVILNGNKVLKITVGEVEQEYEPTSAEEKQDRRNEIKARGTLLMALPNKDQLKFHSYKDAKLLMEAIEKRYGGNKESKKIYEPELTGSSITSQNLQNVACVSSNNTNSNNNNSSTNEADNTAYGVSAAHTQSNPTSGDNLRDAVISRRFIKRTGRKLDVNGQRVGFDRSKVECYNCHKNGHFARECRAPRNQENRGRENSRRTVTVETPTENALVAQDGIGGYDWSYQAEEEHPTNYALMAYTSSGSSSSSDSEVDSCSKSCVKAYATLKEQYDSLSSDYKKSQFNLVSYKAGLESVEARLAHYKKNEAVFEESINVLNLEVKLRDTALIENKKKLEKAEKERDELKLTLEKFQNSSKSLNDLLESQVIDKFKTGLGYNAASSTAASPVVESFVNSSAMLENQEINKSKSNKGYHAVPPPFTGNFIPFKPDLTFIDVIVESENMDVTTIVTPSNVKTVESNHESTGVKRNGDAVEPKTVRMNSFRLRIRILMMRVRYGKINTIGASVNTAVRPINNAGSKPTVNNPRSITNAFKKGYSQDIRPFNKYLANQNSIFNKKVNTDRVKGTTAMDRAVGNPQQKEYKEKSYRQTHLQRRKKKKGVIDRGFGHINFKNINKLVKGNLVRGLTSKIFENIILVLLVRKESNTKPPGIKREFSVARTPQQNGVAERRNKTLIETTRTITPVSAAGPSFTNDDPSSLDEVLEADLTTWKTNYECQSLFHNQIERDIPKDQIIRDL
ncbi:ribonuclease H-like domain-containing protein [Tanacetum coccineum]